MPVVDCEGKLTTLPTKLLTLFKLCECIRAGVFPKLPSNPATLLKACTRNTVLAWRVGGFLPSHGYSKHESKFFFWRFARPIVRCTVLTVVSTFPFFFIGISVPIHVHVVIITVEVPQSLRLEPRRRARCLSLGCAEDCPHCTVHFQHLVFLHCMLRASFAPGTCGNCVA